jgi:uncharacterized protein YggE
MRCLVLFLAAACAAFAQLDANVITVTASRQVSVPPDQVSIAVTFPGGDLQTLNLLTSVFPTANLMSAGGSWTLTFVTPIQDLTASIVSLHALASENHNVSYYVQGATVSPQAAAAQQCPYPALINDARVQAGKLASAAGVTLGQLVSMAQGNPATPAPTSVARLGDFLVGYVTVNPFAATVSSILASPVDPSCSLTVQFAISQ